MEYFFLDLLKSLIESLLLAGTALLAIWFYFRMKPEIIKSPAPVNGLNESRQMLLTLKLQSCERIILFLERITPNALILRVNLPEMTLTQLQGALVRTVREEFEFNLSQQLYLTTQTWEKVRHAKEDIIQMINSAASGLPGEATTKELIGEILKRFLSQDKSPLAEALESIKKEIR